MMKLNCPPSLSSTLKFWREGKGNLKTIGTNWIEIVIEVIVEGRGPKLEIFSSLIIENHSSEGGRLWKGQLKFSPKKLYS